VTDTLDPSSPNDPAADPTGDPGGDVLTHVTPALATPHPTALHSGIRLGRYYGMHAMSAVFPLAAGLAIYGWRAAGVVATVLASALCAHLLWRRVGRRGAQLHLPHVLWLAALLALCLPPQLFSASAGARAPLWPVLPAAAFALVAVTWLLGGAGSTRLHPVIVVFLLLAVGFRGDFVPRGVLDTSHLFFGDTLRTARAAPSQAVKVPWTEDAAAAPRHALWREPAAERLLPFTKGVERPVGTSITLDGLLRDRMPPLEDLIIAGHPSLIGSASAIAAIVGGLFLLYHGLIDARVPLLIFAAAFAAFLVLPIPVVITEAAREWRWVAARDPGVGWGVAVTFANYQLMAGPLPFVAFFIATAPTNRPMTRPGRTIYAVTAGLLVAAAQLYADVVAGPFLGVLGASLLTPALDRLFGPRPLV
jgi:Na+-translocating ferredoxin:NAD+ oxidoreductase RnfD subunit